MNLRITLIGMMAGAGFVVISADPGFAQLAGSQRETFIKAAVGRCTETIKNARPEIPEASVSVYCDCFAIAAADITTSEDLDYVREHAATTEEYRRRVAELAPRCNAAAGLK
jgi:hypothetical protein